MTDITITRDIIYAEPAGTPLSLDIFQPSITESAPVVMCIHGGGWCQGVRQGVEYVAMALAEAGYLAISVSYRLAPAFPYPASAQDMLSAAAWIAAHAAEYGGDATRLGAYGGSAGAHLALWLATAPDTPLTCAVPWAGPTDMLREPVTRPYRSYALAFMNGCEHEIEDAFRDASPLHRLTPAAAPMLLVHGTADVVVPADHARWMLDAARAMDAPVEIILLDDVGHTGGDPSDPKQAAAWQAMFDFFARHLR